jgi:hypothetical protein
MARKAKTQHKQNTTGTPTLLLAFELEVSTWHLGFTTGAAQRPRERQVPAGGIQTVLGEIGRAKQRFGLPADTRVVSGYEAPGGQETDYPLSPPIRQSTGNWQGP